MGNIFVCCIICNLKKIVEKVKIGYVVFVIDVMLMMGIYDILRM